MAVDEYSRFTGDESILQQQDALQLLSVYSASQDGLIFQPPFSDWQDSVKRSGALLFTQLLFLKAIEVYSKRGLPAEFKKRAEKIKDHIRIRFYGSEEGLYREQENSTQISLDSQFFLFDHPELLDIDPKSLYSNLKQSVLWKRHRLPGVPVEPQHPKKDVSWTTKLVGLRHYHDNFCWGWLTAEAYKLANKSGDLEEGARILNEFSRANEGREYLSEVYEERKDGFVGPVLRYFYRSEVPFTWTAAKWVEALYYSNYPKFSS